MANLSGNRSSGENNWDFYVIKSKNYDLRIENNVTALLHNYPSRSSPSIILNNSSVVRVIEPTLYDDYALCEVDSLIGFVHISNLRKPTKAGFSGTLIDEMKAITTLNNFLMKRDKSARVIVYDSLGRVYVDLKQCLGAIKIDGTPKADFCLYNDNDDKIFISHKSSKRFQQYSGLSAAAGKVINEHPEVVAFMNNLTKYVYSDRLMNPCVSAIRDPNLISCCIFGNEFGKEYGPNNVHMVASGDPFFVELEKDVYSLQWTDNCAINGCIDNFNEDYIPVLGATYRSGRSFKFLDKTYRGTRIACYPISFFRGRKEVAFI